MLFPVTWRTCCFLEAEGSPGLLCNSWFSHGRGWLPSSPSPGGPGRRNEGEGTGRPPCRWTTAGWPAARCIPSTEDTNSNHSHRMNSCISTVMSLRLVERDDASKHFRKGVAAKMSNVKLKCDITDRISPILTKLQHILVISHTHWPDWWT